jgi:phage tail sheath protein FI
MAYSRPGTYFYERFLSTPIASTATAVAAGACIGAFERGPESVTLVTSWYDFVRRFGGYNNNFPATFEVSQFFKSGGTELYVRRVLGSGAAAASKVVNNGASGGSAHTVYTFTAKDKGEDGNLLRVQLTKTSAWSSTNTYFDVTVLKESGTVSTDTTADDVVLEVFTNVNFADPLSSDWAESVINSEVGGSQYVTLTMAPLATGGATLAERRAIAEAYLALASGANGAAPVLANYQAALYTGTSPKLYNNSEFSNIDRPLVFFAPGIWSAIPSDADDLQDDIASWASANNGFAVMDTPSGRSVADALTDSAAITDSANAAVYYPWIYISDPVGRKNNALRKISPASSVAGLYLATDRTTGPFKAPAGIRAALGGAVAIERQLSNLDLDTLNANASPINAVRDLPGAGVVVMGARTLLQDGTPNRYVNMRRSLIYIKKRLSDLSQNVLFETNDEQLWARIRTSFAVMLNEYRNQGGLRGETAADAFYVKCDAENNGPDTVAQGQVNIEVGLALEYPAEFVVITLSQTTGVK